MASKYTKVLPLVSAVIALACQRPVSKQSGTAYEAVDDGPAEAHYPPETAAGSPPRPLPEIRFQPADLTTSVGNSPLVITVDNLGSPVGQEQLKAIAAAAVLADNDGVAIPIKTEAVDVTDGQYGPSGYRTSPTAHITVSPTVTLADKWYSLRLRALPDGLAWPKFGTEHTFEDGTRGSRFNPGSHPTPRSIRICDKSDARAVIVDFSERILLKSETEQQTNVAASSRLAQCVRDPYHKEGSSTPLIRYLCQNLAANDDLVVQFDRNIQSLTGGTLGIPADPRTGRAAVSVRAADLQEWGEGCRIARPW